MYFVGIDISKFKHDCAVIDEIGDTIQPSWSFRNDREGFSLLKERLDSLPGEKKIGLEATGHYGQNLKLFLEANGFAFMEFNPLLVSRFVHGKSLRNTKTDPIDAGNVAQYLMTVEYKPYPPSFYHLDQLKSLTRFRSSLVRQRSRQLVELTNVLDKMFPEFKPFFKGKFSATALYILDHYQSPERIASMNTRSYEPLRKISRGHFSLNDFVKLKTLAKNTVGCRPASFSRKCPSCWNSTRSWTPRWRNWMTRSKNVSMVLTRPCSPSPALELLPPPSSSLSMVISASSRILPRCSPSPAWNPAISNPASRNPPATWLSMALLISAVPFSTAAFHLFPTNLFSLSFAPRNGLRGRPIRLP